MLPLLVIVLETLVFKIRIRYLGILGLFLGCVGSVFVMSNRLFNDIDLRGIAACLMGVFALAIATLSVREASSSGNTLMIVGLQMLIGGLILVIVSSFFETWSFNWTPVLLLTFTYMIENLCFFK